MGQHPDASNAAIAVDTDKQCNIPTVSVGRNCRYYDRDDMVLFFGNGNRRCITIFFVEPQALQSPGGYIYSIRY